MKLGQQLQVVLNIPRNTRYEAKSRCSPLYFILQSPDHDDEYFGHLESGRKSSFKISLYLVNKFAQRAMNQKTPS